MSNQQNPFPGGSPTGQQGPKKGPRFNLSWVYGIIAVALVFLYIQGSEAKEGITRNISYSEFKDYVSKIAHKREVARTLMIERHRKTKELILVPHTDGMSNQRA